MILNNLDRVFIVAELGINHNGCLNKLKKMIEVAKDCGADAVKLQVMDGYDLVAGELAFTYGKGSNKKTVNLAELFYEMRIRKEWLKPIYDYCNKVGIICFATPFSFESVDLLEQVENPIYKISSGDLSHLPLIDYIAKKNKPLIMSTGKSTLSDIDEAVRMVNFNGNDNYALLHCVSVYPTPYDQLNLNTINTLQSTFKCPVGFSDHSEGYISSVAAVCKGAKIVEKHFTLSKSDNGPDHWFSLNPSELKLLVENIRLVELTFGSSEKSVLGIEKEVCVRASRSIVAAQDIPKGSHFTQGNITFKRPGYGIPSKFAYVLVNKISKKNYKKNDLIYWEDL